MAVRNLRGIGSTKPIPVYVWIPPLFSPIHKVEIFDGTTVTDITDIIIEGEYVDGVTETIGSFIFKIDNSQETFTSLFSTYDTIRIYLDYGTVATTQRFNGVIERLSKSGHTLIISGRGEAAKYIGKNVTYSATSKARSTILSEIIAKYFTDLTTTNLETDSTLATVNYTDKPFLEVVEEICNAANFSAYVDKDSDFHYFAENSRQNITEAAVHDSNIINVGDFSPDASEIFNKVKVYGKETAGLPLIATAEDSTSQTTYKVKELKIDDSNITTEEQAQVRADFELSLNKDPVILGEIISLGLPTLLPGEMVRISDPQNGLDPAFYNIRKFRHIFSNDEPFQTVLTVKKERTSIPQSLKKRIKFESSATASNNPNELDFTKLYDFNSEVGSHNNTQININDAVSGGGYLEVKSGSTGTWTSPILELDHVADFFEFRFEGVNTGSIDILLSTDAGNIYTSVPSTLIPSGRRIRFQLVLHSASTQVNNLLLMYN